MPGGNGNGEKNDSGRSLRRDLVVVIASAILSAAAAFGAMQTKVAVLETKVVTLETARQESRALVSQVDGRLQRIEQSVARIEAKLEAR